MKQVIFIILTSIFFLNPGSASADKTDRLIQLLIKKNIITADEAKAIVKELGEQDRQEHHVEIKKPPLDLSGNVEMKYDKGAIIRTVDKRHSITLNARFHGLFSYENPNNSPSQSTFRMRRARILASGNTFYPWLKYGTQITLEGSEAAMRDAYMEATYFELVSPRFGQYKVPFDREFLDGGFDLQLIERSIASSEFSLNRDIGLQVSGKKILNVLDYSVGIFNGSGVNQNNVDNDYMYVGRLVCSPFGPYPYRESAVDAPSRPLLALGLAGAYMPGLEPGERAVLAGQLGDTSTVPVESNVTQWTVDLAFKYRDFSFMSGYHYRNIRPMAVTPFGEQDGWGIYFQSGFFIIPKHFEFAGRYSYVNPDNPNRITDNDETELTLGLNYYFSGHNIKTGINYSLFSTEKQLGDEDEHLIKGSLIMQF